MPSPGCSFEDLRWFFIREIGAIKETARTNGQNVHQMQMQVDVLKGSVGTMAEAHLA